MIYIIYDNNGQIVKETLEVFCQKISKRNNSVLYRLEKYLNDKMLSNDDLREIRNIILDVSASINRLPETIRINEDGDLN
jgi:hypothetical protein